MTISSPPSAVLISGPSSVKKGKQQRLIDSANHHKMRSDTLQALSPEKLRAWRSLLAERAIDTVDSLPTNTPVNLLASYADPFFLFLAETVTSITHEEALLLCESAKIVSKSAAEPYDSTLSKSAKPADELLRNHFQSRRRKQDFVPAEEFVGTQAA